jgi:hypothetical protein
LEQQKYTFCILQIWLSLGNRKINSNQGSWAGIFEQDRPAHLKSIPWGALFKTIVPPDARLPELPNHHHWPLDQPATDPMAMP